MAEQVVPTAAVTIAAAGGGAAAFGFVAASAVLTCSPASLKTSGYLAKNFRMPMPSLSESWPQRIFMEKKPIFALPLNSFSNCSRMVVTARASASAIAAVSPASPGPKDPARMKGGTPLARNAKTVPLPH